MQPWWLQDHPRLADTASSGTTSPRPFRLLYKAHAGTSAAVRLSLVIRLLLCRAGARCFSGSTTIMLILGGIRVHNPRTISIEYLSIICM